MDNKENRLTNGSALVHGIVTLVDVVLANCVLWCIMHSGLIMVPEGLVGNDLEGAMCVTLAAMLSLVFYSTIIHRRRVSVMEIIMRSFRLTLTQSLFLMLIVRLHVGMSQSVLRLSLTYWGVYFAVILVARFLERVMLNKLRRMGHNTRSVVFVGSNSTILKIYNKMQSQAAIGYDVLGYYANHDIDGAPESFEHLGSRTELVKAIERGESPFEAEELFCSLSTTFDGDDINTIINYCDRTICQFFLVPRIYSNLSMNLTPQSFGDFTVFTNHTNNINRLDNRLVKRTFDVIVSAVVCVLLLPLIPIMWIIVKLQSPGPLFFSQKRTGLNGETFVCYKFRSMHVNSDADTAQATKDDPRKFPFGEFMRRTNIDELPQFFNVLKGDMCIVGPRPHMLYHTEMYSDVISKYMVRHFSKPGITGWAQVTGFRGETKELWQMEERIKRDIWYNENWSFKLDMEIILRTILQMILHDENAY